jgi:hypothetical protein
MVYDCNQPKKENTYLGEEIDRAAVVLSGYSIGTNSVEREVKQK